MYFTRTVALTALAAGAGAAPVPQTAACDRACLEGVMDTFLKALAAHNTSLLPTTANVLYVENDQVLTLGTGEWRVAGAPGRYRHVFADPERGQVGAITTLQENGVPLIYVARLKVEGAGEAVSEIETQITRDAGGAALYENMTTPEAVWLQAVPAAQRIPRAALVAQADRYYRGMERNDPHGDYSFFDAACDRIEDALQTTNQKTGAAYGHSNDTMFASLGCAAQFQTGFLGFVTRIRARRFPVVDEERQAVLAMTTLDHNGTVRYLPDVNGVMAPIPHYFDVPRSLQAAEAFRLRGDKLYRIEMTLTEVPYRMQSPFEASEAAALLAAPGVAAATAFAVPCDRACLFAVTDRVLHAMLRHRAADLPLAAGARYTENGQALEWDNGLWETLQEVTWPDHRHSSPNMGAATAKRWANGTALGLDYAVHLADPAARVAGYWGLGREQATPGVLALRVQLDAAGRIAAVDALDVRAENTGARGGTMTLMRPPLPAEWEGDALGGLDAAFRKTDNATGIGAATNATGLVDSYFDSWQNHGPVTPFAPGCTRRDNGHVTAASCAEQIRGLGVVPNGLFNHTTAVRDRHTLVADARQGIVLAVALVDNPASRGGVLPATERVPSTYMVPQLLKVDGGVIERVEGMVKWMPYGYTSVW